MARSSSTESDPPIEGSGDHPEGTSRNTMTPSGASALARGCSGGSLRGRAGGSLRGRDGGSLRGRAGGSLEGISGARCPTSVRALGSGAGRRGATGSGGGGVDSWRDGGSEGGRGGGAAASGVVSDPSPTPTIGLALTPEGIVLAAADPVWARMEARSTTPGCVTRNRRGGRQ